MKTIKEKPKSGKQKPQFQPVAPLRQAARLMKEKYLHQFDQRRDGTPNETEYATNKVESGSRLAVEEVSDLVRPHSTRPRKERIKEKPRTEQPTPEEPVPRQNGPESSASGQRAPAKEGAAAPGERTSTPQVRPANAPKERAKQVLKMRQTEEVKHTVSTSPEPQTFPREAGKSAAPASSRSAPPKSETARPFPMNDQWRGPSTLRRTTASTRPQAIPGIPTPERRLRQNRIPAKGITPKLRGVAYQKGTFRYKAAPAPAKTAARTVRPIRQTARQRMTQQAVAQTQKAAKNVTAGFKRLVQVTAKATAALAHSLIGLVGGGILAVVLVVVIVIAAVANSPFGLFFAEERNAPGTVSVAEAEAQVNMAYNAKLEELQADGYDSIDVQGQPPDWAEVLAVFAVKTAGADVGGLDVATLDPDRVARLTAVFWDMTAITAETETIDHPGIDTEEGWTETILHITITPKTADDMRTVYAFTDYQNSALDELLGDRPTLSSLAGSLTITNADAKDVLKDLPADLYPERREIVRTALTLYGKVNYFWGGKSSSIGWDSRWGTLQKVWAEGSSTTGTYRPFGLDCSGYVDWVFNNALGYVIGHGGGARAQHGYCDPIGWENAIPGDLVFFPEDTHVGIVCGRDESGNLLVIHCASSANNVVITGTAGFTSVARPDIYGA